MGYGHSFGDASLELYELGCWWRRRCVPSSQPSLQEQHQLLVRMDYVRQELSLASRVEIKDCIKLALCDPSFCHGMRN